MEADGSYLGEIASAHPNRLRDHEVSTLGKKRKFLAGSNHPTSKYTCCETLIEHDPSRGSVQVKVFCAFARKEKASLDGADEDARADSTQESTITMEETADIGKMSCGIVSAADRDDAMSHGTEFHDFGICEDDFDEFGHCLGYLASTLNNDNKQQSDEELDDDFFLATKGMDPKSFLLSSEGLTANLDCQMTVNKPTIDQEFEQYFSSLML